MNPDRQPPRDPVSLMRDEMRVRYGPVADSIGGERLGLHKWLIKGDEFLLRLPGIAFHYARGQGVTIDRQEGVRTSEEQLYLNGSVYAAAACINGFYPVHASAVAHGGAVHAFTGPAGAGKSTLVAGLGAHGLPMFCDDTLILDLSDPDRPLALPGHKRLKLTAEALALTGAEAQEQVDDGIEKFYAVPPGGDWREPLPLAQLVFIEDGDDLLIEPIAGAEKVARLSDDHYTAEFHQWAARLGAAERFAVQGRLARAIAMARLVRPRDTARFGESVALAAGLVCSHEPKP